jgi:hypothetical protein
MTSNNLAQQTIDQLFSQCVNIVGNEENQKKLKNNVIDPLVTYFKQCLRFFYVIITMLLCMILIANVFMVIQFFNLKGQISTLLQSLPHPTP